MSDRLRASDRDRENTVDALREAASEGRLTVDELDERVALAYAARTRGELTELLDDLRVPEVGEPAPPARTPWFPGREPFGVHWTLDGSPGEALVEFMDAAAAPLRGFGYDLVERGRERLVFARSRRPGWTIAVAILLFPVGLVALIHTVDEIITVDFVRKGRQTMGYAQGVAPLAVRRAFARLEQYY